MSKTAMLVAGVIVAVGLASPSAHAAAALSIDPTLSQRVAVGQENVTGAITITNANSGADSSMTLCNAGDGSPCTGSNGISLIPSCRAVDFAANCIMPDAGVFDVGSTATGAPATACAGMIFAVALTDAGTGELRLTPTVGHVHLPAPGAVCRIQFSVDVLRYPADADGDEPGFQTIMVAHATGTSNLGTAAFARSTSGVNFNASPAVTAAPSPDVMLGGSVSATAKVDRTLSPTSGTVAFRLFGPDDSACTGNARHAATVPITSTGTAASPAFQPTQAGTYRWVVAYGGDASNEPATTACGAYQVAVTPPAPPPPPPAPASLATSGTTPCFDCDRDGFTANVDCNDADPAIHPAAADAPGNARDEDCNGSDARYQRLSATVVYNASRYRGFTRFDVLFVRDAPAGSTVRASCKGRGCLFKLYRRTLKRDAPMVDLFGLVDGAKLRPGTQLEITVTKPDTIGVARRLVVRRSKSVRKIALCIEPGKQRPSRCR